MDVFGAVLLVIVVALLLAAAAYFFFRWLPYQQMLSKITSTFQNLYDCQKSTAKGAAKCYVDGLIKGIGFSETVGLVLHNKSVTTNFDIEKLYSKCVQPCIN